MPSGLYDMRFLDSVNIQTVVEQAASVLERERPLVYIDRLRSVDADDDEITARFVHRNIAADVIAPDGKALVYEAGQITLFVNQLAKVKYGKNLSENQLQLLDKLRRSAARTGDMERWFRMEQDFGANLMYGVRQRQNFLAVGMMTDSLNYSRLGIQFTNLSWGMPANLKVTVNPAWSLDAGLTANITLAKPVHDILQMDRVDADNYGLGPFTRVTLSSTAFDVITQTDDFRNRASLYSGMAFPLGAGMLGVESRRAMTRLLGQVLEGKEVVIDDAVIREQQADGSTTTTRYLPPNKVLLDRRDNGPLEWDWGNAVLMESIVSEMVGGGLILGENPRMMGDGAYGPLAYYTAASSDVNPPGVNAWCCVRGFPRKHTPECSAVLTVW